MRLIQTSQTNKTNRMHDDEIDYEHILREYRSDPYGYVDIFSSHTGQIRFHVRLDDKVEGTTGKWHHIPGTQLFTFAGNGTTSRYIPPPTGLSPLSGTIWKASLSRLAKRSITIKHPLKKREIIEQILRQVLLPFPAPERAEYFFSMEIQARIEKFGQRSVSIKPGDELFTMSLMKRDTPSLLPGPPGIIHSVYFQPGISVSQGDPLIGICPPDKMP